MIENKFAGAWKLVSFTKKSPDGQISYPYGYEAMGYIIYSNEGIMSATIMRADRKPLKIPWEEFNKAETIWSKLKYFKTTLKYLDAAQSYLSYCGLYDFDDKKITHHVKVCLIPNWVGKVLVRYYEFTGNYLILSVKDDEGGIFELRWERIGQ